jgi:hypothetical protein
MWWVLKKIRESFEWNLIYVEREGEGERKININVPSNRIFKWGTRKVWKDNKNALRKVNSIEHFNK